MRGPFRHLRDESECKNKLDHNRSLQRSTARSGYPVTCASAAIVVLIPVSQAKAISMDEMSRHTPLYVSGKSFGLIGENEYRRRFLRSLMKIKPRLRKATNCREM